MTILLLLAAVMVCVLPLGVRLYDYPRITLLAVASVPLLAWAYAGEVTLRVSPTVAVCLLATTTWGLARAALSIDNKTAVSGVTQNALAGLCVLTALSTLPLTTVFAVITVAGCLNAVAVFLQELGFRFPHKELVKKRPRQRTFWGKTLEGRSKSQAPLGLQGNEDFLGLFMGMLVFVSGYLAVNCSPWWFVAVAMISYGLAMSACRVAIFAVFTGLIAYFSLPLAAVFFLALIVCAKNIRTFKYRMNYLREAWVEIKKTPIMGIGFNNYKTRVALHRLTLKREDPKYFDDYQKMPPCLCHNDFVQHILDNGIVGAGLYYFVVLSALLQAEGLILCGILALLVMGLGMHTFHILPLNVAGWVLVMSAFSGATVIPGGIVPWVLLFTLPAIEHLMRVQVADIYFRKGSDEAKYLRMAGETLPDSSIIQMQNAVFDHQEKQYMRSFERLVRVLGTYDGEVQLDSVYASLGNILQLIDKDKNGFFEIAEQLEGC